jgi:hypothetical protein
MALKRIAILSQNGHIRPWNLGPLDPWTLGPLDPWTLGPLDPWTLGPLDPWTLWSLSYDNAYVFLIGLCDQLRFKVGLPSYIRDVHMCF